MSDRQPLLDASGKLPSGDDDGFGSDIHQKQVPKSSFSTWRRYFSRSTKMDANNKKPDDEDDANDRYHDIGFFEIFRHADGISVLLMLTGLLLLAIHAVCVLANLALFGKITGVFAVESFDNDCHKVHRNLTALITYDSDCPLGIAVDADNNSRLYKLCHNVDTVALATSPSSSLFRAKVMTIIYWLILIAVVVWLASFLEYAIWSIAIRRQTARMNILLFQSLLQRNVPYFDKHPASQFNSNLFGNIAMVEKGIGVDFLIMLGAVLGIWASLITCFIINWKLSLILFFTVPIVMTGSTIFSKLLARETENEFKSYSSAGRIVQEVVSSVRTVFSLNGAKFEQQRYEKELESTHWSTVRQRAICGVFMGWLSFSSYIVYAVGFIFASMFMSYATHHGREITDVLVIIMMFAQCLAYFGMIVPFFQSFSEGHGAGKSGFRPIDEERDPNLNEKDLFTEDASNEDSVCNIVGDIEFKDINLVYPSRKDVSVLHNLNLIARTNKTTALVGGSGSGKSTCMSLLLRFYEPSSGEITIDGQAITQYSIKCLRQNIGIVSQEPILFAMTIYENIRLGKLNATRKEIEEAAKEASAHDFIMKLPHVCRFCFYFVSYM
ncbi:unnamed protein product [Adineta ricciae]|uniref:ABC transmembrane type-1 domain-containing protein n=1 Tax=Adineta ricciae TaxID=249248 RepID=A0A815R1X3_ADIRI|nr:unnamed protein product [Adineta ricciae]